MLVNYKEQRPGVSRIWVFHEQHFHEVTFSLLKGTTGRLSAAMGTSLPLCQEHAHTPRRYKAFKHPSVIYDSLKNVVQSVNVYTCCYTEACKIQVRHEEGSGSRARQRASQRRL